MQFRKGDVSQCIGAVDGMYFTNLGIKLYVIAIKNYTFIIPLEDGLIANTNQTNDIKVITGLIKRQSPCKISQSFQNFPYLVVNNTILVTPLVKGQVLEPIKLKETVPPNFEVGRASRGKYVVCYPSDVVRDYIQL